MCFFNAQPFQCLTPNFFTTKDTEDNTKEHKGFLKENVFFQRPTFSTPNFSTTKDTEGNTKEHKIQVINNLTFQLLFELKG